jgi:hypothetical protein
MCRAMLLVILFSSAHALYGSTAWTSSSCSRQAAQQGTLSTLLRLSGGGDVVRELADAEELEAIHEEARDAGKLVVVDFTA